ncbi:THUMP domain-containing protein 3, partial [Acipenser ruthenus]
EEGRLPGIATAASDEDVPATRENDCDLPDGQEASKLLKFRVTCNRAGEKHNFTSNEAARDFGGAVQDFFLWKPDMTKFDIEVLLNIHNSEVVVAIALTEESLHKRNITHFGPTTLRSTLAYGMLRIGSRKKNWDLYPSCLKEMGRVCRPEIGKAVLLTQDKKCFAKVLLNIHNNEVVVAIALTEESLHKRNITHFGPTTLRSTLAYGMLRLCKPQPSDIIIDPMCGTGAIPLEGAMEWPCSYYMAGDNNELAINRTINNINHIHNKRHNKGRIGSRKKNWDLYPSCLKEMGRVCRPEIGKAVLLTQDKKCFAKTLSTMGHLWQKSHTVWVNVGGLHAAVYFLKRTSLSFNKITEDNENKEPAEKTKTEE